MLSESLVGKEKFLIPTENKNDENEIIEKSYFIYKYNELLNNS